MKKRESRKLWVKPLIEQADSHDSVVLLKVVSGEWSGAQRLTASDRSSPLYIVGTSTKRRLADENRPCVVISPDEMNRHIGTVIVAPLTICGSPPHAWGRCRPGGRRFTPTCVTVDVAAMTEGGSPPHAWGRQLVTITGTHDARFTPTCVGKTWSLPNGSLFLAVHPHMRGEDAVCQWWRSARSGSPPHAWGRRPPVKRSPLALRFTPTCVGKTRATGPKTHRSPVHPHMRGEDLNHLPACAPSPGSPPHAWGRQLQVSRSNGA